MMFNLFGKKDDIRLDTTAKATNVKKIVNYFLYTLDGQIMAYLKVEPISVELFSKMEQKSLERKLTNELSIDRKPWKLLAVPRPLDLSNLVQAYQRRYTEVTNVELRRLIREEIIEMEKYNLDGSITTKNFYVVFWDKDSEAGRTRLKERVTNFYNGLYKCGLSVRLIEENEIIELCNLVNNPKFAVFDHEDYSSTIPLLKS